MNEVDDVKFLKIHLMYNIMLVSGVLHSDQRLIEFFQENTLVTANTLFQQHKRRLYTWISPDGLH